MDTFSKEWKSLLELIVYGIIIATIVFICYHYFREAVEAVLPFILIFAALFGPGLLALWLEGLQD